MLGARRGSGVWFNRRDSKSRVPSWHRGFESPPLRAAPVCVCRSMERLMDVANEMNEKGEVASCGPICHSRHYEDDARTHRFLP
jgi:hypothetical protein